MNDDEYRTLLRELAARNLDAHGLAWEIYANPRLKPNGPDLVRERDFMENLVQTRFNFFIISYGVILVYGLTSTDLKRGAIILFTGAVVLGFLAFLNLQDSYQTRFHFKATPLVSWSHSSCTRWYQALPSQPRQCYRFNWLLLALLRISSTFCFGNINVV